MASSSYQEQKKSHEAKLKQKQIQIKEVKFRPHTDEGDYNDKVAQPDSLSWKREIRPRSR